MNRKNFLSIILLLAISLISILFLQFSWINDINNLNEERFKKDIQDVLYFINERLEEKEIINLTRDNLQAKFKIRRSTESGEVELIESSFNKKTIDSIDIDSNKNSFQFDIESGNDDVDNSSINASIQIENLDDITLDSSIQDQVNKILDRSEMIQIILNKLLTNDRTIKSDFDIKHLDKLIKIALAQKKLNLDFEFLIYNNQTNIIEISNSKNPEILNSEFKINLFQNDLIDSNLDFYLYFPNQSEYLKDNNFFNILFSIIFLLIIVFCFYYVLLKVFELKKLSDIKNDFIDNMTHELKTPISTISLACEALLDKTLKVKKEKSKYIEIISDENKRLGIQVEKVLDVAKTERDNYKIEFENLNLHDVINESIKVNSFRVEKNQGKINLKLKAKDYLVKGNYYHLLNVFNNLIDNSIKYSKKNPIIHISTYNNDKMLVVEIKDEGIGISKSNIDKVFDKFFREPQGNIHNVKGFGLGLSYVKNILNKHNSTIKVESKQGNGTIFIINFKNNE